MAAKQTDYMERCLSRGLYVLDEPQVQELLAEPLIGVLAWTAADGGPRTTPLWYLHEDGAVWLVTGVASSKARALRRSPSVSFTVDRRGQVAQAVTIQGSAELLDLDEQLARRLVARYLGPEAAPFYLRELRARMDMACIRIRPLRAIWVDLRPLVLDISV